MRACVRACVRAYVRACVSDIKRMCVYVSLHGGVGEQGPTWAVFLAREGKERKNIAIYEIITVPFHYRRKSGRTACRPMICF